MSAWTPFGALHDTGEIGLDLAVARAVGGDSPAHLAVLRAHRRDRQAVDVAAAALFAELTVEQVSDLDLSYMPPLGSPWDALPIGAQVWTRTARRCPRA